MTEQVGLAVRRIAEQITTHAPDGWAEAVLVGAQERHNGLSVSGWYSVPDADPRPIHPPGIVQACARQSLR